MNGSLPGPVGLVAASLGVLGSFALAAGCGSMPQGDTIGGAAGASASGPIFAGGQGGGSGTGTSGASGSGATGAGASGTSGGGSSGAGASANGGGSNPGPDASVSQCGSSIAGLGTCGAQTVAAQIRHPNMLVVLDKSGSTTGQPTGFTVDIWDGLKTALSAALDGAKSHVAFGLDLFPDKSVPLNCTDNCCTMPTSPDLTVPIEDGVTAVPKITAALNGTIPGGGTPTAAALGRAYDYFTTGAGASLVGDKYVMLATVGGPNCNSSLDCSTDKTRCTINLDGQCMGGPTVNCCPKGYGAACLDDAAAIDAVKKLAAAGIKTFVVGIPNSEAYASVLDAFATAGGETNPNAPPQYYKVDASGGVAGLTKVFTDITTQLVTSCEIPVAKPPQDPGKVNVAINCQAIGSSGTDGTDGWILDQTTDPQKIVLQGSLCKWVQQQGAERVDIVFGCPTLH